MKDDIQQLLELTERRAARYKKARIAAEKLLEQKSRDLFVANKKLENMHEALKDDIAKATLELSVSNQRLQSALDEKSNFIGQMSHEVRTPLNAIIGLSEIIQRSDLDEEQMDYINTISEGANSLIVLLNDMLEITKIEAGRIELNPEPAELRKLLKHTVSMFKQTAKEKGLSLSLKVYSNVPEVISIDIGRYKQIVNNLISNAVKNTEEGGVVIQLSYTPDTISEGVGTLLTRVIDSGVGIPKDKLDMIFNAYEQLGQPVQGVGLGLSICQQLSELMMGKISCKSKVGRGSFFESKLPAEQLDSSMGSSIGSARGSLVDNPNDSIEKSISHLPKLKILVAEDNPTNQKVISAQLAQLGQTADMADNGKEAIEKLNNDNYDVLICDILMPVMDGEQTIKAIREEHNRLSAQYCIALTASSHQDQKQKLLALGFDAFLSKPASLQQLVNELHQVPQELRLDDLIINPFDKRTELENANEEKDVSSVFDYSFLQAQFGDAFKDIFSQIAPSFLDHAYTELEQLEINANSGNTDQIKKLSHSIKGAANSIGLTQLAELLLEIEKEPGNNAVPNSVKKVRSAMQELKPILEQEIGEA